MACFVIGDIHGCCEELLALVDAARLTEADEIIALGDLFDRGPDPAGVLRFFRERPRTRALLGNHEREHLHIRSGQAEPDAPQRLTRELLGGAYDAALAYMATLPVSIELPDALLVHAFWEPGLSLTEQTQPVLVGTLSAEARLAARNGARWYELYDGPKPLVVGHHDYLHAGRPLVQNGRVFGIDTGCCHGGALTGLLLPGFRFVSVPSRANHWARLRRRFTQPQSESRRGAELNLDESVLTGLARRLEQECRRIVSLLRNRGGYDALSKREQAQCLVAIVGDGLVAALMHRACHGELPVQRLRRILATRSRLQRVLRFLRRPPETSC